MQDRACAEERAAVCLLQAPPLCRDSQETRTCAVHSRTPAAARFLDTVPHPHGRGQQSAAEEQELCLDLSSQDWHGAAIQRSSLGEVGAQEPCQPYSAPGDVVVVQLGDLCFLLTTDNHSNINLSAKHLT